MKRNIIAENLPQAFVPGSQAAKDANKRSAEQVLQLAKSQNRTVRRAKPGEGTFFQKEEPKVKKSAQGPEGFTGSLDTAELLEIKVSDLWNLQKAGKIQSMRFRGKLYYSGEEIERFKAAKNR